MNNIKLLYLMELIAGFARGSYLGCIGWTTLVISNSIAVVGQIFIVQSITIMILGPLIGVIIDRYKQRSLIIWAQIFIATAILFAAGLLEFVEHFSVLWFFAVVITVTSARLMYRGTFDCVIKAASSDGEILPIVARSQSVHLIATAAGMASAGILIEQYSSATAFTASASMSVIIVFIALALTNKKVLQHSQGLRGYWQDFRQGLELFKDSKDIQILAVLSTIALPIGQLTNAILSSFIRDDLGAGSDVFGIVDAGWAIGGMFAAALLSNTLTALDKPNFEYYFAVLAGIATVSLALSTSVLALTLSHGLMGFFVWSCRLIIAGRVLSICGVDNVGRTRVYMEVLVGITAMISCFSPTIIHLNATADYFLYWGLLVISGSIGLIICNQLRNNN